MPPRLRLHQLRLPLDHAPAALRAAVLRRLGIADGALLDLHVARRGHDARRRDDVCFVYTVDVEVADPAALLRRHAGDPALVPTPDQRWPTPATAPAGASRPVVVGAGPCGLFAALALAEAGHRPIVLERGKAVRPRTADTWALWRGGVLTPESNAQFGEGGAGTFSDGKLYSGVKDPQHHGRRVLATLVECGAPEEILFVAKPHVGTFRLVQVVERLRARIEALGGEYKFGTRVEGLQLRTARDGTRALCGLMLAGGDAIAAERAILAPGHSARDTFAWLAAAGVAMRPKPFSIGVRIEHPQALIDRARFGARAGDARLGAADYKLAHRTRGGRGTYSFCMCPGGRVVAAASEPGGLVTNGMSQYSRAEFNANAGLVVGVDADDFGESGPSAGPLAGIAFQRHWERRAFAAGGGGYRAPAQRVGDLLADRASTSLGGVVPSYQPGVEPGDLRACLPGFVVDALIEALPAFARALPGFALPDAVLTGVETRTSSPLRIERDEDGQSPSVRGLYPAGEGAGYAGGILSAAIDGLRVAEALAAATAGVPPLVRLTRQNAAASYG